MGSQINTPTSRDIWHLSIDDLFSPLTETSRLGGSGPFVINLTSSTAPVSIPSAPIVQAQGVHVYQIQRLEDRRLRYRLRFGPFATEEAADAILREVREIYPGALTATADGEDLKALQDIEAPAPQLMPTTTAAAPPVIAAPAVLARPAVAAAPAISAIPPAPVPPAPIQAAPIPVPPPLLTAAQIVPSTPAAVNVASHSPAQDAGQRAASFEITRTLRALTSAELQDNQALRWFIIELAISEQPFDPDSLPNLDIFSAYRLYVVEGVDQGRVMHRLRLGFFGEEVAAQAVAAYLAEHYERASIKRVSVAERQRFEARRLEPRKDVGATGLHAIIEITDERYVREKRGS